MPIFLRSRRSVLPCLLLLLAALISACSSRPPAEGRLPRAAKQQLQQGLALTGTQPAEALRQFEAAHRLAPGHPALMLNMGLVHRQLQHHGAAAAWLNAWLATDAPSPQRNAIEQQFRHEQVEAGKQATPLLRDAIHTTLQHLQEAPATAEALITPLATGMAASSDIYGSLRLLSESERLLQPLGIQGGWLPTARDRAWETHALVLVLARQIPAAERARRNLLPGPRREHFWDRLATHPADAYRDMPAPLSSRLDWIIPLASFQTIPLRELPADAAERYRRAPLTVRTRELAEAITAAQTALAAAATATPAHQGKTATVFNTLLFLMEASAAERHTASP
jgi:hypothetical protein